MKKEFEFYTKEEIKRMLLKAEKLVYVDNGFDEFLVKYNNLPDFIVDLSRSMGNNCNLKVYKYPAISMTPILTTIGEFLDKCDADVRDDIHAILSALQITGATRKYKIINEDNLENVREELNKVADIKIKNIWLSDNHDINCNASIFINGREKANIITTFDRTNYPDWKNSYNEYKEEIKEDIEKYLYMPKISKCSKLLTEIYDNVCESESSMCHITDEEWSDLYANRYSSKDIDKLKKEIKKYNLEDVITFDNQEYKIIGWGDLKTKLNDDRTFIRKRNLER